LTGPPEVIFKKRSSPLKSWRGKCVPNGDIFMGEKRRTILNPTTNHSM